jgi:hypothetical protein
MTIDTWKLALGAASLLGVATAVALRPYAGQDGRAPASSQARPAPAFRAESQPADRNEQARLEAELQRVSFRLAELEAARRPEPHELDSAEKSPTAEPPAPVDTAAVLAATHQLHENEYDAATGYSNWARQSETAYRSFRSEFGRISKVACKAALCRLEAEHDSPAAAQQFLDEIEIAPDFVGMTLARFPLDESLTRFVFFVAPASAHSQPR